jgi:hypothetical protein
MPQFHEAWVRSFNLRCTTQSLPNPGGGTA